MPTARQRHEALLVELHREMKEGRGEGDRANEIGDEMNVLWEKLDDEERELFDELSEDLYLIEGKRRVVPLDAGETALSVRQQMTLALQERRDPRGAGAGPEARRSRGHGSRRSSVGTGRRLGFPPECNQSPEICHRDPVQAGGEHLAHPDARTTTTPTPSVPQRETPKMKIAAFYSYKGGVGRSLFVANLSLFLARFAAKKVLTVDLDLEAPGLHYKYEATGVQVPPIPAGLVDTLHDYLYADEPPARLPILGS